MVATQPKFDVVFKELAVTAVQRTQRGTVILVLNDDTNAELDKIVYTGLGDVKKTDFTAKNYDLLTLAFLGDPQKVIVIKAEDELSDTAKKLETYDNYILCYPDAVAEDVTAIKNYLKIARGKNNYSKVVVGNALSPDAEYVINFATDGIKANINGEVKTFTAGEYAVRIAGALSGLAPSRSLTYYELPEIVECNLPDDADADVEDGKLVIIHQDGSFKFGRAVNSLTTLTDGITEAFQKIRIVEILDTIANDFISTFRKYYVGKYTNNYTNKCRLIAAFNAYLETLAAEGLLEAENNNKVYLSIEKIKTYLKGKGVDVSNMTNKEIEKANTGSYVFLDGVCSPTDAMEDLDLGMYLFQAMQEV
jgi:hypothetical protein